MGRSRYLRSYIELGKDGAGKDLLAHGATPGAYLKWDKDTDTLMLVNANFDIVGDIEIEGDLTLTTEDVSVVQGRRVYLSGQDGDEYISSEDAGYLDLEALTAIRPGADLLTDRWQEEVRNTLIGMGVAGAGNLGASAVDNTGFGYQALYAVTAGRDNSAFGATALRNNTSGIENAAFGSRALEVNTSGHCNSAFGSYALQNNTTGKNNTAVGWHALFANIAAENCTAMGYNALDDNTTGTMNSAFGEGALAANIGGAYNDAFGGRALYKNTTGGSNVAVGQAALFTNVGGDENVAVGRKALQVNTEGKGNIGIGFQAGNNLTTGDYNIIIGYDIDAPSATADAQLKIGGSTGMGYILGDATGDMTINAVTGKAVHIAVNGTDEYDFAAAGLDMNDNAMTEIGDMTFTDASIIAAIDGGATSLIFKAGGITGTTFITLNSVSAGTDNMVLGKAFFHDVGGEYIESSGALLTIAGITNFSSDIEASAVGTASVYLTGGLGVAKKVYIGTELLLVAGPLDMSTVAEDIEIKADTDSALEIKGAATLLDFDTRTSITGITAFAFTVPAATIATAGGITRIGVSITPGTTTLSNSVGVTAMEGLGLYVSAPILTSAGNPAVALASTVYIANAPQTGGTATITAGYALKVAAGGSFFGGAVSMVDDQILTLGTTTTNAETKITLEFDETTTGVGQLHIGDLSNAQVLVANPGATVVPVSFNYLHSQGSGDCDDFNATYTKFVVSGAGDAGLCGVAIAARAYVEANAVVEQMYGIQSHVSHKGTGGINAMWGISSKITLGTQGGAAGTDDFTGISGIGAGWFIVDALQSDVDVTCGNFVGVGIEIQTNVKGLDAVLNVSNLATSTGNIFHVAAGTCPVFLTMVGSPCVYNASFTGTANDPDASIKVNIEGHDLYLYCHATPVS